MKVILAPILWTKEQEINVWVVSSKSWLSITSPVLTFKEIESWRSLRVVFHTCEGLQESYFMKQRGWRRESVSQSHYTHWISLPYGCKTTTAHPSSQHTLGSIQYEHAEHFLLKEHYEKTKQKAGSKADLAYIYKNILFPIIETWTLKVQEVKSETADFGFCSRLLGNTKHFY